MFKAIKSQIENCRNCENIEGVLLEKPKVHIGGDSPKVMLIGHSPSVRVAEKAETVLKMDKPNGNLYKYITKEILEPLGIEEDNLYCTNLIKCFTEKLPEDVNRRNKNYIEDIFEFCSRILEKEVELIKPELIISLSERVLKILSKKYMGEQYKMNESFGKLYTLNISNLKTKYIPVVHFPKPYNTKIKEYYFPEQTNRLAILKDHLDL